MEGNKPKQDNESTKTTSGQTKKALRDRRDRQLIEFGKAIDVLQARVDETLSIAKRCTVLSDHSEGFYEEIDKLAKGKALLAVTDLIMGCANDIIRDAKAIVTGDIHLDRIKEFVAAGDNPNYPDVLISIRSVRDSLARFDKHLEERIQSLRRKLQKAETVIGALTYFFDEEAVEEEDDDKNYPSKERVESYVEGKVSSSCFSRYRDSLDEYFNFCLLYTSRCV